MYQPLDTVLGAGIGVGWPRPGEFIFDGTPDMDARIQHYFLALSEHPGIRFHLERHNLRIGPDSITGKLRLLPENPHGWPAFVLDLWRDPAIRPLFDQYGLTVYEGNQP